MLPLISKLPNSSGDIQTFSNLHILWGIKEYEEEHANILLQRESLRMPFHFQSPQISYRAKLVDWMKHIAVKKKLDDYSIHLGVYLLDVFMDNYNIVPNKLQLIALVCLLIATKFEERDCNILKATEMNDYVNNKYTVTDFYGLEILLLKHLKWNLLFPTVVHFIHIHVEFLFSDDENLSHFESESELWCAARHIIKNYLDFVMEDIKLTQEKPSVVSAAIMASTRSSLGFSKMWPAKLSLITGYKLFELKSTIARFKQIENNVNNKIASKEII